MNKRVSFIFLGIETILYLFFMGFDLLSFESNVSTVLKFTAICGCFFYSVLCCFNRKSTDQILLCIALFFTVCSDIFLLLSENYLPGIFFFIIVQGFYTIRILRKQNLNHTNVIPKNLKEDGQRSESKKSSKAQTWLFFKKLKNIYLIRFAISFMVCLVIWNKTKQVDFLLIVTVFYIINFSDNIHLLFQVVKQKGLFIHDRNRLFLIGLMLYFVCDIMVGLYNIKSYVTVNSNSLIMWINLSSIGMWMFYLPGKVLITMSGEAETKKA